MRRRAIELVRELKRAGGSLTPYDTATVSAVVSEIRQLWDDIITHSDDPSSQDWVFVQQRTLLHEKECAIDYLLERLELVKEARWELGSALPDELAERLSSEETEFFNGYSRLVGSYMASIGLDISQDVTRPPKELFIEVRGTPAVANSDVREVYTASGPVTLDPGTVQFVKRDPTIEALIRKGVIEHVT